MFGAVLIEVRGSAYVIVPRSAGGLGPVARTAEFCYGHCVILVSREQETPRGEPSRSAPPIFGELGRRSLDGSCSPCLCRNRFFVSTVIFLRFADQFRSNRTKCVATSFSTKRL